MSKDDRPELKSILSSIKPSSFNFQGVSKLEVDISDLF